jgi:hypothetical protein
MSIVRMFSSAVHVKSATSCSHAAIWAMGAADPAAPVAPSLCLYSYIYYVKKVHASFTDPCQKLHMTKDPPCNKTPRQNSWWQYPWRQKPKLVNSDKRPTFQSSVKYNKWVFSIACTICLQSLIQSSQFEWVPHKQKNNTHQFHINKRTIHVGHWHKAI